MGIRLTQAKLLIPLTKPSPTYLSKWQLYPSNLAQAKNLEVIFYSFIFVFISTLFPEAKMTLRKVKNVRQRAAWHQREREGAARPVARWLLWVEALAADPGGPVSSQETHFFLHDSHC